MPKYAFLGVRACELHAIAIQDKVFYAASMSIQPIKRAGNSADGCHQLCSGRRHMFLCFHAHRATGDMLILIWP